MTEEIYQTYYKKNEKQSSIHLERWPKAEKPKDSKNFDLLIKILTKVRRAKSNAKKSMNSEISLTLPKKDKNKLKNILEDLKGVTNSKEIKEGKFKVEFI